MSTKAGRKCHSFLNRSAQFGHRRAQVVLRRLFQRYNQAMRRSDIGRSTRVNRPPTVLIVDDDQAISALMRDFLEAEGLRVETAGDAQMALATLERARVECLLLDVMLPGQN